MICPYCDSLLKEAPESGTCPNCGGALARKGELDRQSKTFPDPPIGIYADGLNYIQIEETYVKLFTEMVLSEDWNHKIPYTDIDAVSYTPAVGICKGYLTIRDRENRLKPMPKSFWRTFTDKTTIWFEKNNNEKFYNIYTFLKKCAEINAAE